MTPFKRRMLIGTAAVVLIIVVLVLLSIFWLWKLYEFPPPYDDDRETGS